MQRSCPVCGGNARTVLFHQTFAAFSGKGLFNGYDVVTCSQCGCGYADGIPGQPEFDAYYRDLSKYEHQHRGGAESAEDLSRFRTIADALGRFIPAPQARILEVGCSTGRLLALLKESGFPHVAGLDPSPSCSEAALRLYGVPVLTGSLGDLLRDPSRVEMLILIGVLEHLHDLRPALKNIHRKLSSHGRVYVEVPDVTGFTRFLDAPYQQFSTEHVIFFSPVSLSAALAAEGFRPLLVKQDSRPHAGSSVMPVLWGVFEKAESSIAGPAFDSETRPALESYIHASARVERDLVQQINTLVETQQPVFVWGVGTLTRRLLSTTRLGEANIVAFIDSNPKIQGQSFEGIPVLSPDGIRNGNEAILIASWVFGADIERQIRTDLGCNNAIIRLSSDPPSSGQ